MKIFQPRFFTFFLVMLVLPAGISYFAGFDTNVDSLFFLKALAIAFFITVLYYLLIKNSSERRNGN